ncbi:protein SET DOMAIN GROUP 41-like isoform X1 [Zingiber officinale]|uniref:protein SET DOMAIN GROUP 41-like isoform X1 n=1 Tax=Zingiber officinale TaxID=94328 RepID=UPI001C4ADFAC|nr:protein SET DOMAIN GROUP 41-like isoform X1 [Zingiber officinale]
MEMQARKEVGLAQDLIPPLPPLAAALHRRFFSSHCAGCFRPLEFPFPCAGCRGVTHYCDASCCAADFPAHYSSGECHFLRLHHEGDSSDIRAALRLLHFLESMGSLPSPSLPERPRRVAGLLASDLDKVLEEGGELAERITEGATLMSVARDRDRSQVTGGQEAVTTEEVLWAVITNAVEVHVNEVGALGVAVFGPGFSWFNHSCMPNACYRFELAQRSGGCGAYELESFLVSPAAAGLATESFNAWISGENKLAHGFSNIGPRVIVRSIKPIQKDEEVCITYIDLLEPKVRRHADLLEKYRFVCCCGRCRVASEMYMDFVLNCDARELSFNNYSNSTYPNCEELADLFDQAMDEYRLHENPEACSKKLESMLYRSSVDQESQAGEKFKLHPLHHLSLNSYITLASAYRAQVFSMDESNNTECLKLERAAVSYTLLLAGVVHHLFLSEPSLIAVTAHFLINAAESILVLLRLPEWSFDKKLCKSEIDLIICHYPKDMMEFSLDKCRDASMRFLGSVSQILFKTWPYLTQDLTNLKNIDSPVNFNWLGSKVLNPQCFASHRELSDFIEKECVEDRYLGHRLIKDQNTRLFQLALHCFIYGRYLASICYGPECYLVHHAENILHGLCKHLLTKHS